MKTIIFISNLFFIISFNSFGQNDNVKLQFYYEDSICIKSLNIQIEQDAHIIYNNTISAPFVEVNLPPSGSYSIKLYSENINSQYISNIQTGKEYNIALTNDSFFKDTVRRNGNDLNSIILIKCDDASLGDKSYLLSYMKSFSVQPQNIRTIYSPSHIVWAGVPFFSWNYFSPMEQNCNSGISSFLSCDYKVSIQKPSWYFLKRCTLKLSRIVPQKQLGDSNLSDLESFLQCRKDFTKYTNDKYYTVYSYINKNSSWICPVHKTEKELKYNQVIFMLTELHARLLSNFLSSYNAVYIYKYRESVVETSKEYYAASVNEYKIATKHGKDMEQIIHWYELVNDSLKQFPEHERQDFNNIYYYADQIARWNSFPSQ